jgi:hypothetical protein
MLNQIASDHAGLAQLLRGEISGEAMEVSGGTGGVPAGYALGEQPADHAGQDISGPSGGHPRAQESNLFRNFSAAVQARQLNTEWPDIARKTQCVMERR